MQKRARNEDEERDSKDLKMQKLQAELEEVKTKYLALSSLKPHELVYQQIGALPNLVQHSDFLLHNELDATRKQNDMLVQKVIRLEKELSQKSNNEKNVLHEDSAVETLRKENDVLSKENQDLKHNLRVNALVLEKMKKSLCDATQRCVVVEEENERLSSQMQIWQQMQLNQGSFTTTGQFSDSTGGESPIVEYS